MHHLHRAFCSGTGDALRCGKGRTCEPGRGHQPKVFTTQGTGKVDLERDVRQAGPRRECHRRGPYAESCNQGILDQLGLLFDRISSAGPPGLGHFNVDGRCRYVRHNRRYILPAKVIGKGNDVVDLVATSKLGIVADGDVALPQNSLECLLHLGGLEAGVATKADLRGGLTIQIEPELARRRRYRRYRDRLLFVYQAAVGQILYRVSGLAIHGQGKSIRAGPVAAALHTQGLRLIHAGGGGADLFRDTPIRSILNIDRLLQPQTGTVARIGQRNRFACQRADKFKGKAIGTGACDKHIAQPDSRNPGECVLEAGDQNRVRDRAITIIQGRNSLPHPVVFQRIDTLAGKRAIVAGNVQVDLGVGGFTAVLHRVGCTPICGGGGPQLFNGLREFRLFLNERKITVQAADPFDSQIEVTRQRQLIVRKAGRQCARCRQAVHPDDRANPRHGAADPIGGNVERPLDRIDRDRRIISRERQFSLTKAHLPSGFASVVYVFVDVDLADQVHTANLNCTNDCSGEPLGIVDQRHRITTAEGQQDAVVPREIQNRRSRRQKAAVRCQAAVDLKHAGCHGHIGIGIDARLGQACTGGNPATGGIRAGYDLGREGQRHIHIAQDQRGIARRKIRTQVRTANYQHIASDGLKRRALSRPGFDRKGLIRAMLQKQPARDGHDAINRGTSLTGQTYLVLRLIQRYEACRCCDLRINRTARPVQRQRHVCC